MNFNNPTLCFPDHEKSCFACCPPIRPPGYEHVDHKNIVGRILRENSENFRTHPSGIVPITGFSCWALGYLDEQYRLVGCLLHPGVNQGTDLRYRIDFGEKCRREICPEAKVFSTLVLKEKRFWLQLAEGLDALAYSSRKLNPLFQLMNWGRRLLSLIASKEGYQSFDKETFFHTYPLFSETVSPRSRAYLLNRLINKENLCLLKTRQFALAFETFSCYLSERLNEMARNTSDGDYTHLLALDRDFLDFLRLSARIAKIEKKEAVQLKARVDDELGKFRESFQ